MTTTSCKYQAGQQVEVSLPDFTVAGMPRVWFAATVAAVSVMDAERGLFNVQMVMEDGRPHVETVGPRGGGKKVRAA